jgi:hypothetical protein
MKNIGKSTCLLFHTFISVSISCYSLQLSDIGVGKNSGLAADRIVLTDYTV